MYPQPCGCIYYDYGPSHRCPDHPGDDDCEHKWEKTTTVWKGETHERLTRTCTKCGEVRGRA